MPHLSTNVLYTRAVKTHLTWNTVDRDAACNREVRDAQVAVETEVRDARMHEEYNAPFTMREHGFQFVRDVPNTLSQQSFDTNDRDAIEATHSREVAAAVASVLPGGEVVPFHYACRHSTASGTEGHFQRPATAVHCDYTFHTAVRLFDKHARPEQRKGRFMILNAWRNVAPTPVRNYHLAVCDASSVVAPDDFVQCEVIKLDDNPQTYRMDPSHRNSPGHRWWHYPNMTRNELLLFVQYDSDPTAVGRYCFHCAVTDSTVPPEITRTSCETRLMVFFPDHTPCTIPEVLTKGSGKIGISIEKMMSSLCYAKRWPEEGRKWLSQGVHSGQVEGVLKQWIHRAAKRGDFMLEGFTEAELALVAEGMMAGNRFERVAKQYLPR